MNDLSQAVNDLSNVIRRLSEENRSLYAKNRDDEKVIRDLRKMGEEKFAALEKIKRIVGNIVIPEEDIEDIRKILKITPA